MVRIWNVLTDNYFLTITKQKKRNHRLCETNFFESSYKLLDEEIYILQINIFILGEDGKDMEWKMLELIAI